MLQAMYTLYQSDIILSSLLAVKQDIAVTILLRYICVRASVCPVLSGPMFMYR